MACASRGIPRFGRLPLCSEGLRLSIGLGLRSPLSSLARARQSRRAILSGGNWGNGVALDSSRVGARAHRLRGGHPCLGSQLHFSLGGAVVRTIIGHAAAWQLQAGGFSVPRPIGFILLIARLGVERRGLQRGVVPACQPFYLLRGQLAVSGESLVSLVARSDLIGWVREFLCAMTPLARSGRLPMGGEWAC